MILKDKLFSFYIVSTIILSSIVFFGLRNSSNQEKPFYDNKYRSEIMQGLPTGDVDQYKVWQEKESNLISKNSSIPTKDKKIIINNLKEFSEAPTVESRNRKYLEIISKL